MNKVFEFRSLKKMLDNYGPELASVVSLVCIGLSGYSAFKASKKVTETKADYEERVREENETYDENVEIYLTNEKEIPEEEAKASDETRAEFAKAHPELEAAHLRRLRRLKIDYVIDCALDEKWAIIFGVSAAAGQIFAMKLTGDKIAILAGGLGLSQDKLKKFVRKTKETIGEEEFEKIKNEIRADEVTEELKKNPDLKEKMEAQAVNDVPGNEGSVCFEQYYDDFTGSLFEIPESQLMDAKRAAYEYFVCMGEELDFNKWRSMLGLPDCLAGKTFKFDREHKFEIRIKPFKYGDMWIKAIEYPTIPSEYCD